MSATLHLPEQRVQQAEGSLFSSSRRQRWSSTSGSCSTLCATLPTTLAVAAAAP